VSKKSDGDAPPCGGDGCFNGAVFEVIPRGRWRNMPITKACKKCSLRMANAYTTRAGERGWADLEMIVTPPAPPKKTSAQARIQERSQRPPKVKPPVTQPPVPEVTPPTEASA
jgi:hypothetical protein